ncbi:hypothetical protein AMS68_003666 [Peltaster fructicola]|uniref:Uncharacterized protein n=1 Tax=Peltaster fructicola TaxID=286661 RepID=A0A6H0XU53_9PEZI|nr:hypothetical protein AMS68_003666 [Peltaster fructicola]
MPKTPSKTLHSDSSTLQLSFIAIYLASSVLAAYLVRIRPVINGQPIELEENLAKGVLAVPGSAPIAIRQDYTGIEGIDVVLRTLVAAFIAGPARLEKRVWLQQFHFLLGFAPMMGISVIESSRACWKNSWAVRYTWTWGILYQTVAGALAMPCYMISFILASRRTPLTMNSTRSYLAAGQDISAASARATLPTTVLGYVAPTAAMYFYPWSNNNDIMAMIAVWMFTPMVLDLLMAIFQSAFSIFTEDAPAEPDAGRLSHLTPLYGYLAIVAGFSHIFTVYLISTSPDPAGLFLTAFIPDSTDALSSTIAGFHNIFQWDWLFVAAQQVLWALYGVYELKVAGLTSMSPVLLTIAILVATVVAGPGGSLVLAWWWRETKLVEFEKQHLKEE